MWREYVAHLTVERQRRPGTIAIYANTLDRWGRFLGRRDWRTATSRDLGRFLAKGCGPGRGPRTGQPLADATRRHYTAALKSFYRWAYQQDLLDRDPMAAVVLGRTPTPMPRDIPLADVRSLLVWVAGDERAELCVSLAYFAGLRVSEIAALRIEDVVLHPPAPPRRPDDDDDDHPPPSPYLRVLDSKYGRSRVVPVVPALGDLLGGYLAQRPGAGPVLCRRRPADGQPMTGSTVSDTIRAAMKAAGVKARPHDLRHTYATQLLQAGRGENLLTVSRLLGHSSTALTEQVYGLGYRGELDEVAALLPDPRG